MLSLVPGRTSQTLLLHETGKRVSRLTDGGGAPLPWFQWEAWLCPSLMSLGRPAGPRLCQYLAACVSATVGLSGVCTPPALAAGAYHCSALGQRGPQSMKRRPSGSEAKYSAFFLIEKKVLIFNFALFLCRATLHPILNKIK